jgi:hypothetical protein
VTVNKPQGTYPHHASIKEKDIKYIINLLRKDLPKQVVYVPVTQE